MIDERAFAGIDDAEQATNSAPCAGLNIVRLADVEPEQVTWLWRGRIPEAKVTLVAGDPGSGKTFLTLAVSAALTRGRCLPDDSDPIAPMDVLVWNGEDGLADTLRPRAEQCGADLTRLHVIESALDASGARTAFGLASLPLLAEELERRPEVRAVIIDPLAALLEGVDTHRDTEVRAAIQPLADLAKSYRLTVICVLHLRKSDAARALYRVGGSIGFTGLARSVLLVAKDPDSARRAVVPLKANLCAEVSPIEFRIDDDGFWWGGAADELDADTLLRAPSSAGGVSAERQVADAILSELAEGGLPASELSEKLRARGFKDRTIERARSRLKRDGMIAPRRECDEAGRPTGPWRWTLHSANTSPNAEVGDVRRSDDDQVASNGFTPPHNAIISVRGSDGGVMPGAFGAEDSDLLDYAGETIV